MRSDMFGHVRMRSDAVRSLKKKSCCFANFGSFSGVLGCFLTFSKVFRGFKTFLDVFGRLERSTFGENYREAPLVGDLFSLIPVDGAVQDFLARTSSCAPKRQQSLRDSGKIFGQRDSEKYFRPAGFGKIFSADQRDSENDIRAF